MGKIKKISLSFIFVCTSLVLLKPFIVDQLGRRGDGYLGYNMHNDAIRQYRKALLLDPVNSNIMIWLGYAYKLKGDKNRAIDIYKRAIEIDPQNIAIYHDLGMVYITDKKFKIAREYFLKASSIPYDDKKISRDEYIFYHETALKMLSLCRKKEAR